MALRFGSQSLFLAIVVSVVASCQPPATPVESTTTIPRTTPLPEPTGTTSPIALDEVPACPPLSAETLSSMETIQDEISMLRGLSMTRPIDLQPIPYDDVEALNDQSLDVLLEETRLRRELLALILFDAVDADFDLEAFYRTWIQTMFTVQYDPQWERVQVVCNLEFNEPAQFAFAHETALALLDQHYGLEQVLASSSESCLEDPERCAAESALVQGDAALLESQWLRVFRGPGFLEALSSFRSQVDQPFLTQAPAYLRTHLLFPYLAGLDFVRYHYLAGGWAAVDELYAAPPTSSEQILHPERYPEDIPLNLNIPSLTDALGEEWRAYAPFTLGELHYRALLELFLPSLDAEDAAEGWGGDGFIVLENTQRGELGAAAISQWDSVAEAHNFYSAFRNYGTARFGEPTRTETGLIQWSDGDTFTLARLVSNQVLFIMAPDTETLLLLDGAFLLPLEQQP